MMSFESWEEEFYPVPAAKSERGEDAIRNSLRKWEGLTKANLEKHGLIHKRGSIFDSEGNLCLAIDSGSCSLCYHHLLEDDLGDTGPCDTCPLTKVNGQPCTEFQADDPNDQCSPYGYFITRSNPHPMISLIKEALKKFLNGEI